MSKNIEIETLLTIINARKNTIGLENNKHLKQINKLRHAISENNGKEKELDLIRECLEKELEKNDA